MKMRANVLGPVIIVVFFAGIGLSMAFNLWETESTKEPAKYVSGQFEGEYNPADIRGSYSFQDVANSFDVEVDVLAQAFGVSDIADPAGFKAKDLETIYGGLPDGGEVGTDALRLFVARYIGLPYTAEESTRLPNPAVPLLKDKLAPADLDALRKISVSIVDLQSAAGTIDAESAAELHNESTDTSVKGKTTFSDLLDWGLSKEQIEEVLNMEMGPRSQTVRDFLMAQNLEFGEYKIRLQELLDSQ